MTFSFVSSSLFSSSLSLFSSCRQDEETSPFLTEKQCCFSTLCFSLMHKWHIGFIYLFRRKTWLTLDKAATLETQTEFAVQQTKSMERALQRYTTKTTWSSTGYIHKENNSCVRLNITLLGNTVLPAAPTASVISTNTSPASCIPAAQILTVCIKWNNSEKQLSCLRTRQNFLVKKRGAYQKQVWEPLL